MITAQDVREALAELSVPAKENDGFISKLDLEAKLRISSAIDRTRLYGAIKNMVYKGVVVKSADKQSFRYIPEAAPPASAEEGWARVYRACRTAKGSFDVEYIVKVAAITPNSAKSKIGKLRELGYLDGFLESGQIFYRATKLLRETPEVPLAPKKERASLAMAREAMAELNRMFITLDLASEAVKNKVREQIGILQNAFEKGASNDCQED